MNRKRFLFLGLFVAISLFFGFKSNSENPHAKGCSELTLSNGNCAYPPTQAFVDLLQRSSYLYDPETIHFLQNYEDPLFHTLTPFYVVQRNGTSCSLATATMILNAVMASVEKKPLSTPATQNEVLEMVNDSEWFFATTDEGPGVTLEQYGNFLKKMFHAYGLPHVQVDTVYIKDRSEETLAVLRSDLRALSGKSNSTTFLALDFEDGIFLNREEIRMGHISPVGAYDPENGRVLILDVDRQWTGPYWISEETLIRGLNTLDETEGLEEPTYRGYIRITMPET